MQANYNKPTILLVLLILSMGFISANEWIYLDGKGEVSVNDAANLDGFSKGSWNMWINQDTYTNYAGFAGKYQPVSGGRSYLIRAANNGSSISFVLSGDGVNTGLFSSDSTRKCGVNNDKWTMITVTYDGTTITYYKNGIICDIDKTTISKIYNSNSPLRIGGGNSVYLAGGVDEYTFYDELLSNIQIQRIFNESVYGTNLGESIPVLVYHQIQDNVDTSIVVTPAHFNEQMRYLHDNGFETITMKDYNNWKKGSFSMPKKPVIIVFDDGFSTVYTNAKPIMDDYGFKGTVAVVTRYASFTGTNTGYMKWADINSLKNVGWDMESHSITHSHMLSLNESAFRNQLTSSRDTIKSKTGETPTSFIFPFHESNSTYTKICGEYYDLCWTQGSTNPTYDFKSTDGKKYLGLRRINVVDSASLSTFASYFGKNTNLVGKWDMEEGQGTTTVDSSGNENTGHLLGGASWSLSNKIQTAVSTSISTAIASITSIGVSNGKNKNEIEGIDNVIDSDKGKKKEKVPNGKKFYDNMNLEGEYYDKHKELTDPSFVNKPGQ